MSGPAALVLVSGSLASDAAHLASRDIAAVADDLRVDYRLVGGNAVTLLTYVHHVDAAVPLRETADADLGAHLEVLGEPALLEAMTGLGYTQPEGNRFVRHAASPGGPLELAVDVLAPSRTGRLETNQPVGALVVDAVPGLPLALRMPATWAHVTVTLTAAETLTYTVALPHVLAMLAMKAHAFAGRMATRDAVDIWRLLEAAHAAGYGPVDWPRGASTSDTRHAAAPPLHPALLGRDERAALHQRRPGPGAPAHPEPPAARELRATCLAAACLAPSRRCPTPTVTAPAPAHPAPDLADR